MYATLFFNDSHCVIHLPPSLLSLPLSLFPSAACCCLGVHFTFAVQWFSICQSQLCQPTVPRVMDANPPGLSDCKMHCIARSHSLLLCCLCHVTLIFQHCSPLPIYTHDSLRTSCINISISSFQIEFVFISQNYYVTEPKSWPRALSGFLSPFSLFLCVCHDIKIAESSEFLYSWSSPECAVCGLIMWQWAWLVFNVVEGRGIQICGNHERLKILLWFRLKKLSKQSKLTARQC